MRTRHDGYFLSFPKKRVRGEFYEIIEFNDNEYSKAVRRPVLDEYKMMTGETDGS